MGRLEALRPYIDHQQGALLKPRFPHFLRFPVALTHAVPGPRRSATGSSWPSVATWRQLLIIIPPIVFVHGAKAEAPIVELADGGGRPITCYQKSADCSYPSVKSLTTMVHSDCNGGRLEDLRLHHGTRPNSCEDIGEGSGGHKFRLIGRRQSSGLVRRRSLIPKPASCQTPG